MRTLELPEPSSYPTSEEYSKFVLVPLTSHLTAPVQTEADLKDDPELCNEISTLERLEVRMHAVTATDESDGPSSNPPIADHATMEVIEESSSDEDAGSTNGNNRHRKNEGVNDVHNEDGEDQKRDGEHNKDATHSVADDVQKHSEFPVGKEFWKENSWPKSLLPIKTIIDAIHFPAQTYNQQKPIIIWQEFLKICIPELSAQVCSIPCAPLPTCQFLLGGKRPRNPIL